MSDLFVKEPSVEITDYIHVLALNNGKVVQKPESKLELEIRPAIKIYSHEEAVFASREYFDGDDLAYRLNPLNNQMITETFSDNIGYGSIYAMQLCIQYIFN